MKVDQRSTLCWPLTYHVDLWPGWTCLCGWAYKSGLPCVGKFFPRCVIDLPSVANKLWLSWRCTTFSYSHCPASAAISEAWKQSKPEILKSGLLAFFECSLREGAWCGTLPGSKYSCVDSKSTMIPPAGCKPQDNHESQTEIIRLWTAEGPKQNLRFLCKKDNLKQRRKER